MGLRSAAGGEILLGPMSCCATPMLFCSWLYSVQVFVYGALSRDSGDVSWGKLFKGSGGMGLSQGASWTEWEMSVPSDA